MATPIKLKKPTTPVLNDMVLNVDSSAISVWDGTNWADVPNPNSDEMQLAKLLSEMYDTSIEEMIEMIREKYPERLV